MKQQQELQLILKQKEKMEEELEELKLSNITDNKEEEKKINDILDKKLLKMKKKYEKKINGLKLDIADAAEVFLVICLFFVFLYLVYFLHSFF